MECARGLYGYPPPGQLSTTASGVGAVGHQVRRVYRDREGQGGSVRGFHTFKICFILLKNYNASLEQEERLFDTYQLGM